MPTNRDAKALTAIVTLPVAIAVLFVLMVPAASSGCDNCNFECVLGGFSVVGADGGSLAGANVSFSGETVGTMACGPVTGAADLEFCRWPSSPALGNYQFQVSAVGYQTAEIGVTVTQWTGCCAGPVWNPIAATLFPVGDGGP
jgi:hypothetical protein